MSWHFDGNINGSVYSISQNLPMTVTNFLLVNKAAGTIGVNVYRMGASGHINMMPLNKQLAVGESYTSDRKFVMLATERIRVDASGSCDYDFTISNLEPPEV